MTGAPTTRLVGRIDQCWTRADGKQLGFLVTEDWTKYHWSSDAVQNGDRLSLRNVVYFTAAPPAHGHKEPSAIDIELSDQPTCAEHFGKLGRFMKARAGK